MRKRLVNQQCLSRRLLQLSLLCAMMLAPLGAWAQDNIEYYGITVGGVEVTSANASGVIGDNIVNGMVTYSAQDNKLTLEGVTISSEGITCQGDLNLSIVGSVTVNGSIISSKQNGATLKLQHGDDLAADFTYNPTSGDASGFTSVVYDGMYLTPAVYNDNYQLIEGNRRDVKYSPSRQRFEESQWSSLSTVKFTSAKNYELWLGGTKVTDANKDDIFEDDVPTASFNPTNNTLTLNGMTLTSTWIYDSGVISRLPNLKIVVNGENIITCNDSCTAIRADLEGEQILTIVKGGNNSSLAFNTSRAIRDFNTLTLTGMKWNDSYTYGYDETLSGFEHGYRLMKADNEEATKSETGFMPVLYDSNVDIYDLWVGGVQVTSGNADDITSSAIDASSVSFDAQHNTLTLNRASINMVQINASPIMSGIANLRIKLVDYNEVTFNSNYPCFVKYSGETAANSPSLTFETEGYMDDGLYWLGSLDINGFTTQNVTPNSLTEGYTITNDFETLTTDIDGNSPNLTSGWKFRFFETNNTVSIWNLEVYDLWIGSGRVISSDLAAGQSGNPCQYNPVSKSLSFNSNTTFPIKTSMPELKIEVNGSDIQLHDVSNTDAAITFVPTQTQTSGVLKFVLSEEAKGNPGNTFTINNTGGGAISGFSDVIVEAPLLLTTPTTAPATWDATIETIVVSDYASYGITITSGNNSYDVTSDNYRNILNDANNTVSYSPAANAIILNGATIDGISTSRSTLSVNIQGTNTLDGFTYTGQNKCSLIFFTDAKSATLTMNNAISGDFNVTLNNKLELSNDGTVISLPINFGITIAGRPITPENRQNVLSDGTVSFDTNNQLVLNGATINGEIVIDNATNFANNTLTLYLIGNSTINVGTGQNAFKCNNGELKLEFVFDNNSTSEIEFNVTGGSLTSNVVIITDCRKEDAGNTLSFSAYLPNYVNSEHEVKQTDFSAKLDESSNTNGTIVDNIFLAMGEDANNIGTTGGYDQNLKKLVFAESTAITQEQVAAAASMVPGSPEFIQDFKGGAINLLPGENIVEFSDIAIADGYDFYAKIGAQKPISLIEHLKTVGGKSVASLRVALSHQASLLFYLSVRAQLAPAMKVDHRIGPKSSVAGALGGVKVSNSSVQSSAGPAATYKAMEKATMAAAIADMGDPHNGFICNDPDITDLADNMFIDNSSNPSPALRRAGDLIPGTILPDGLPFIDFSGTKITGMEVSRTSGAFNGVPENVFIYMPAGNTTKDNNVVIGDICDKVELNGSTDAKPFKAMKDFKAGQATLKRTFDAGSTNSKATIYLPYNIEQEDADKLGTFYEYTGNDGTTVTMNTVTTGGLKANKPYIFEAKEGGVIDPLVRVVDVVANPAETEGFKGVYERKEYEAGMYCYAGEDKGGKYTIGQFVEMGPGSYVPPFRAYMIGSGVPSYAIAWDGIIDNMDDENTTAVESVKTIGSEKTREGWWTLNGMRMTEKPKKAGLYILNGRMVVVKN